MTDGRSELIRRNFEVMGTVVSVHVQPGPVPAAEVYIALAQARACMHRADAVFSTWKPDSPVSRMRRGEIDLADAPADVAVVMGRCEKARVRSGGWFDPWAAPGGFDPTGLVKGWATARALDCLIACSVTGAMVSAGGDVAVHGAAAVGRPWRIGIQNPFDHSTVIAVTEPPGAIATSGSYERGLHIFDPFTGKASAAVASASVLGPDLDLADALATAVVAGGEAVLEHISSMNGYEAFVVLPDGTVTTTAGFQTAPPRNGGWRSS